MKTGYHAGRLSLVLCAALALIACRESTQAPVLFETFPALGEPPRAVTHSTENDLAPAWSPGSDSVYYSTVGLPPFPTTVGLLMSVPLEGGTAEPLLPDVQADPTAPRRWLTAPTVSAGGGSVAFVELWGTPPAELCPGSTAAIGFPREGPWGPAAPAAPTLTSVFLRVREAGSRTPLARGLAFRIDFDGRDEWTPVLPDETFSGNAPATGRIHRVRYHPFHAISDREGARFYRPSWSPDGRRLVFSDGLQLHLLDTTTGETTPIPGTEDGVFPAWSPDGSRIAFTRLVRGEPIPSVWDHGPFLHQEVICKQTRVDWPLEGRNLVTVAPDGSDLRFLGAGEQPAWTPDGESLVFRREDRLWLGSVRAPSLARPLTGTEGGSEPAVSPDGHWIAFSRLSERGGTDIWILELF